MAKAEEMVRHRPSGWMRTGRCSYQLILFGSETQRYKNLIAASFERRKYMPSSRQPMEAQPVITLGEENTC